MKDAQDAVKEIREWPVQKYLIENEDGSIEFSDNKPGRVVCTRSEFEAEAAHPSGKPGWGEAKRQTKLPQIMYDHTPDDADDGSASNPANDIPVGWHGECSWGQKVNWVECIKLRGNLIARRKFHWDSREWIVDSIEPDYEFRPIKSERERWCEAAKDIVYDKKRTGTLTSRIYDALKSGELPMPEKD